MKLYILQSRDRSSKYGKYTKWKWDKNWIGFVKSDVERDFLDSYNDYIGNSTMESLKDFYRVKSIDVTLPKVLK